ncbi:MAG: cyclase family protein [Candidatus Binatia bacterium]
MTHGDTSLDGPQGRWGADDERGALNLLTADRVLAATRGCTTGKVYPLAVPIRRDSNLAMAHRGAPRRYNLLDRTDGDIFGPWGAGPADGANEDVLLLPSHTHTHMDALCHIYTKGALYNGFLNDTFHTHRGAARCGIEKTPAFAGRAVLLDLPGHQGVEWLPPGHAITPMELAACRDRQGSTLGSGDILLVRTGWLDLCAARAAAGEALPHDQPGIGLAAAEWVAAQDIAAIGADNAAVEVLPFDRGIFVGVHIELMVKRGIIFLEHLLLSELARDRCYEGLFVVGALPVVGASGSPVNPVVIG